MYRDHLYIKAWLRRFWTFELYSYGALIELSSIKGSIRKIIAAVIGAVAVIIAAVIGSSLFPRLFGINEIFQSQLTIRHLFGIDRDPGLQPAARLTTYNGDTVGESVPESEVTPSSHNRLARFRYPPGTISGSIDVAARREEM